MSSEYHTLKNDDAKKSANETQLHLQRGKQQTNLPS